MIIFDKKEILCVLGDAGIIEYFEIKFESEDIIQIGYFN